MDENDVSKEPLVTRRAEVATEEIILGYAMSRLDEDYLTRRQLSTWSEAYREVAKALSCPPASIKRLRDEFDPFHPNTRVGRRNRDIRPTRQKVMDELRQVSNEGVMVLVDNILLGEIEAVKDAIEALTYVTGIAGNVAERLLTGNKAEMYFIHHCEQLVKVPQRDLLDLRQNACGYDFGVNSKHRLRLK